MIANQLLKIHAPDSDEEIARIIEKRSPRPRISVSPTFAEGCKANRGGLQGDLHVDSANRQIIRAIVGIARAYVSP